MSKPLSEKTIDALLDKLSSDDEFRARFQANPRAAAQSLGTGDEAIEQLLPDAPVKELGSKENFEKSRGHVRKQLVEARSPFVPITLDIPKR